MEPEDKESRDLQMFCTLQALKTKIVADKSMIIRKDDTDRRQYGDLINKLCGKELCRCKLMPRTALTQGEFDEKYPGMTRQWVWENRRGTLCFNLGPLRKSYAFLDVMWALRPLDKRHFEIQFNVVHGDSVAELLKRE